MRIQLNHLQILLLVIFAPLAAHTEIESSAIAYRYYYHVPFQESPYEALKGIHEAKQQVANKRNHFRFAFDQRGRVTEVAFMRNGRLVINTSHDNFFLHHTKIAIAYNGDKEEWSFYNYQNKRISDGRVYIAQYTLDREGNRISLAYFNEKGEAVENSWGIARYAWEKNNDKSVNEKRYNLKGDQMPIRPDFDFYEVKLEFDKNGYMSTLSNYGFTGELTNNSTGVAYDKLVYNSKGDFLGWKVFNKDNQPVIGNYPLVAEGKHTYNEYGDNMKTETFDLSGNYLVASWGYAYDDKTFDAFGNMIEHGQFDQNRNLVSLDGRQVMRIRTEYNDVNQILSTTNMDKNRKLVSGIPHRAATISMKYDDDYRLVEVRYQDEAGKPIESTLRGNAIEKYVYSATSIDTIRYDSELKEISKAESKLKKQLRPLSYMIGNWQRSTFFANSQGGWTNPLPGNSTTVAILNGRFLDENVINPEIEGEPQVSRNSLGVNPETGLYRLIRMNGNALGNMSVYNGILDNGNLILDNLNDTPEGIPAFRFTFSKSTDGNGFEQVVERSVDKGKSWTAVYKVVSRKP